MNKKIAIMVEDSYQDLEVWYPYLRLKEAGYDVIIVGTGSSKNYKGKYGYPIVVDTDIEKIDHKDFDGVIIPGGWAPDKLRMYESVLNFVRDIFKENKLVASICHGGWVLSSASIIKGKRVTSYKAIKDDLINAGAIFIDEEVVVDGNIITSRTPMDLPAFCREILAFLNTCQNLQNQTV